jgi:hypothetical protein
VLLVLVAAKLVPKLGLVYPLARRHAGADAPFATLLLSTGLTFGTIAALYGLTAHAIDRTQFSLLVSVAVIAAVLPTVIAQRWFAPAPEPGPGRAAPDGAGTPARPAGPPVTPR